jgi:hypothetical protein
MMSRGKGLGDSNSKLLFGGGNAGASLAGQYFAGVTNGANIANGSLDNSNRWMISPVCSRFRDHI